MVWRYCPARWIRPKVCSLDRSLLNLSRRLFRKIRPSPIEREPFKARAPTCTVIAHYALNGQMRSKAHTALTAPLVLHHTRIYKCAMKKCVINGQLRNKLFLIFIHRFSLVRAAMNALRICKMCNAVSKTPSISSFFNWPSAQWISPQLSPQLSKLLYNCKLKKKCSRTLKGSQRMGGGRIFLKKCRATLFKMMTFRMSLISTGSISLAVPLMCPQSISNSQLSQNQLLVRSCSIPEDIGKM